MPNSEQLQQAKDLNAKLLAALAKNPHGTAVAENDVFNFLKEMDIPAVSVQLQVLLAARLENRTLLTLHCRADQNEKFRLSAKVDDLLSRVFETLQEDSDQQWAEECGSFYAELLARRVLDET